jgi:DNA (cytosine-5)-methyltransferase 1
MDKKLTFIDLFSGCGGLSEGFLMSNRFQGLAHVEWELPMVKTLRNRLEKKWNHSTEDALKSVIHFDIQKTDELINGNWAENSIKEFGSNNHHLITKVGLKGLIGKQKVDVIIGGPPCQAYSIAGRAQDKNSMKDDYRNYLFESFVKVVDAFSPKCFVFENVPGLLSACPGNISVPQRIYEAFNKIGYVILNPEELKNAIYSADKFGVPQSRKRVIIIGVKSGNENKLLDVYRNLTNFSKNSKTSLSVKDAIGNLPKLKPLVELSNNKDNSISHVYEKGTIKIKHHDPRFHNQRDIKIFKDWIMSNMNSKRTEEKTEFYYMNTGKKSNHNKYRNLDWDKPSPTIVAHLSKDGLMFIHPDANQARSITLKEAALIQSFPDDYEFIGNLGVCYKMVGNAVPPKMAKEIAKIISNEFIK